MEYSVVIAIYGDAYLAEACVRRLEATFAPLVALQFSGGSLEENLEILLVIDGRQDDYEQLHTLPARHPFVRILWLSRNFGQHNATSAGFEHAKGRYVIRLNVDCQDPPEELPRLIACIKETGAAQVVGIYETKATPWGKRVTSDLFYRFFNWLSGFKTPLNTSPLRIMTRGYIDCYNAMPERSRFPQGVDEYLGFKKAYVTIPHHFREDKKSSYNFSRRVTLAVNAAVSFSDRPMYLIVKTGLIVFSLGLLFVMYNTWKYFFIGAPISGYTTLVALLTIFSSAIFMAIGVLGLYIADVQREVKSRPYYLIREKLNFDGSP